MMKWTGRIFLLLAGAVLASDIIAWSGSDSFRLTAVGEWWFWAHPDSLQALQPAIERHVSVTLYESVVQPVLEASMAIVLAILGAALLGLGALLRRRR